MWVSISARARVDSDYVPEVDLDVADNERPDRRPFVGHSHNIEAPPVSLTQLAELLD